MVPMALETTVEAEVTVSNAVAVMMSVAVPAMFFRLMWRRVFFSFSLSQPAFSIKNHATIGVVSM